MLIFSDLHLREESEDIVFNEVLPGIQAAALQHHETKIAFLGDWWHIRYTVSVRLFNRVRDTLMQWHGAGLHVRLLPGNHDQIDVQGRNALEALGDLPHVQVYSEPTWDEDGFWMPYRKDNEATRAALQASGHKPGLINTLFMHNAVQGAWMNDHMANTDGLNLQEFDGWNAILCGHYHKRQVLNRLTYIGSPYQTKSDEAGQPKGYALWDGTRLSLFDTSWGPRHHSINTEVGQEMDLSGVAKTDEIRIRLAGEGSIADAEKLGQELKKAGYANVVVTPEVTPMQARLQVGENASLASYVRAYVEQVDTDLDRDRLMKAFEYVTG